MFQFIALPRLSQVTYIIRTLCQDNNEFSTLEGKRFVERDPSTGVYRPGLRLLQMASLVMEQNSLRRLAAPFLQDLCNQYRENVNLALLDGADVRDRSQSFGHGKENCSRSGTGIRHGMKTVL